MHWRDRLACTEKFSRFLVGCHVRRPLVGVQEVQQRCDRECVGRVRVDVGAQIVRGHPVIEDFGDGDDHLWWRHFKFRRIDPSPNQRLADLGTRDMRRNGASERRLTARQFHRFE